MLHGQPCRASRTTRPVSTLPTEEAFEQGIADERIQQRDGEGEHKEPAAAEEADAGDQREVDEPRSEPAGPGGLGVLPIAEGPLLPQLSLEIEHHVRACLEHLFLLLAVVGVDHFEAFHHAR